MKSRNLIRISNLIRVAEHHSAANLLWVFVRLWLDVVKCASDLNNKQYNLDIIY
jgi:hypothetical protein